MCILTSKAGMKLPTIDQNLTHNIRTNSGDVDFNKWMYKASKAITPQELEQAIEDLDYIEMHLSAAYRRAGEMWKRSMCRIGGDCTDANAPQVERIQPHADPASDEPPPGFRWPILGLGDGIIGWESA